MSTEFLGEQMYYEARSSVYWRAIGALSLALIEGEPRLEAILNDEFSERQLGRLYWDDKRGDRHGLVINSHPIIPHAGIGSLHVLDKSAAEGEPNLKIFAYEISPYTQQKAGGMAVFRTFADLSRPDLGEGSIEQHMLMTAELGLARPNTSDANELYVRLVSAPLYIDQ